MTIRLATLTTMVLWLTIAIIQRDFTVWLATVSIISLSLSLFVVSEERRR